MYGLLGYVAAGAPIEAVINNETIDVPYSVVRYDFVLQQEWSAPLGPDRIRPRV